MSADTTLHNQIIALFMEELNLEVPSIDTDLLETGLLDSLHFVELLLHLERKFGTEISLEKLEIDHFRSVAKIAEFIANHKEHSKWGR